ncbi:hypothetical protein GR160_01220 [Flavobacterium sp. Sd200]|uniref:hypothetical protein n=1 Tax=Flavobacterium sp. Sd200 TaxID=2692211 RepID=UPI00136962F1|nr:hypothetical protein [Flavobacterium sp. Sd200]MXN89836.1 hypothetical protein [Flavobacterium sp. Sd200]
MKKIFLFLAFSAFTLTACSDNDPITEQTATSNALLGTWVETTPTPNARTLTFSAGTVTLQYGNTNYIDTYEYTVKDGQLHLALLNNDYITLHDLEVVNNTTITLGNMYVQDMQAETEPIITTFVRQ